MAMDAGARVRTGTSQEHLNTNTSAAANPDFVPAPDNVAFMSANRTSSITDQHAF
jgi:hypothetical protein